MGTGLIHLIRPVRRCRIRRRPVHGPCGCSGSDGFDREAAPTLRERAHRRDRARHVRARLQDRRRRAPRLTGRLSSATESEGAGENTTTLADQPRSVLHGLNLDTAIRLRWALRDIKAGRMKLSPVSQNDLMALIELGLIEMQDDVPQLTNEGHRAIDWN